METRSRNRWLAALVVSVGLGGATQAGLAQIPSPPDQQILSSAYTGKVYSPYAKRDFATNVYFGDTHLHTDMSMDAGAFGNRLGLDEAYKFARGEQVRSTRGGPVRLLRPLDFLVVSDHSDNMGFFPDMLDGAKHILADPTGRDWYDRVKAGKGGEVALEIIGKFSQGDFPPALMYSPDSEPYMKAWRDTVEAAEKYNEPGRFTAFIGYEWTSLVRGNNLHRVVVYRDGGDRGGQMVPFTAGPPKGSTTPRDLWLWMAQYERKTKGDVLAIAHNGNLSNGIMFPMEVQSDGEALDAMYVRERDKWEPLYEATQIKGDGETHPFLSPDDEFADFETWDIGNLDVSEAKTDDMLAGEYAREALKRGLQLENKFGINPYKFGMIGSTDTHTSRLSTAREENFFGKTYGRDEPRLRPRHGSPLGKKNMTLGLTRYGLAVGGRRQPGGRMGRGQYSRGEVFDAMQRREVYATTGHAYDRLRFFGGYGISRPRMIAPTANRSPGSATARVCPWGET